MRTLSHLVYSVMHGEPVQDCFVSNLQQHSGQKCSWCTRRAILFSNASGICGVWFGFLSLRWASLSMLHQRMFLSSSINDAFIDVQVTSMCRDPYFHRCWIFERFWWFLSFLASPWFLSPCTPKICTSQLFCAFFMWLCLSHLFPMSFGSD